MRQKRVVLSAVFALSVAMVLACGCNNQAQEQAITDGSSSERSHWDKAVAELTGALNINPLYAQGYMLSGLNYYYDGQYDKAASEYTRAIELDPKLALAYFNRGLIYDRKSEYDEALADYTRAIEAEPGYVQAYYNRAFIYYSTGQHDKFVEDFKKGQELTRLKDKR